MPEKAGFEPAFRRRRLRVLVVAIGFFFVAAMVGNAFSPTLLVYEPLWLIALNPVLRHLVLVSNAVDPVAFYGVACSRMVAADPALYLLGRWYGADAILWLERRSTRGGRFLRWARRAFDRGGLLLVLIAPEGIVCVLAGASQVRPLTFFVLDFIGTITVLTLVRSFGARFATSIQTISAFIEANILIMTIASVSIVLASVIWRKRRRKLPKPLADSNRQR